MPFSFFGVTTVPNVKRRPGACTGPVAVTTVLFVLTFLWIEEHNVYCYCGLLKDGLKTTIKTKKHRHVSKGFIIRHSKTYPTSAQATGDLCVLKLEALLHPHYNPDLSSCLDRLWSTWKASSSVFLYSQPKDFFTAGIRQVISKIG